MKTVEEIYNEVVGNCSQNQDYEKAIKARVLKAMVQYAEQSRQAAVSGRFLPPNEDGYQKCANCGKWNHPDEVAKTCR